MVKKNVFQEDILEISKICKAMSHPVRVYILNKLSEMDSCCYSGSLIDELPIGRSALSQHLKELKFADLIQGEIEAPYIKYCLNREKWQFAREIFKKFYRIE